MANTEQHFFPYDRNYILKQAQGDLEDELLTALISLAKEAYNDTYNPLRLNDDTSLRVEHYEKNQLIYLHTFYSSLAGIYRYKFGETQLEFIWDGRSHYDKYCGDWTYLFTEWVRRFLLSSQFLNAVLAATVFCKNRHQGELAETRLKVFLNGRFEVKVHKKRGIVPLKIA